MALTLPQLSRFDLLEKVEERLMETNQYAEIMAFIEVLQETQATDQFIRDCPSYPTSTEEIIRKEMRSAIGATLAIEGTILRDEEIEESFQKADLQKKLKQKEQEAQNSRNGYKYIVDVVDATKGEFVYSEEHVKQIHRCLTENIDYIGNVPGQYRDINPIFGEPPKKSLCRTKDDVEAVMPNLISRLNKTGTGLLRGSIILKAMMVHYYLTEIHPFGDGNGRTARAMEALVLYANHINHYCFWSLANFWSANREKYLVHLGDIRSTCDPWDFLKWGMEGYLEIIKGIKDLVLKRVKQLMLQDYVKWLFTKKKIKGRIFGVLMLIINAGKTPFDQLMGCPQLTALYAKRDLSTRYKDFKKMEKSLGLIRIFKENGKKFIEPNFQKLEELQYTI